MKKPGRGDRGKVIRKMVKVLRIPHPSSELPKKCASGIVSREIIFFPKRTSCLFKRAVVKGKPHRWRNKLQSWMP
jgi:hypothetical protein